MAESRQLANADEDWSDRLEESELVDAFEDGVVTVGGLTDYLTMLIEDNLQLQKIWVEGEVSSCKDHRVGLFITLSDPDNPKQTLSCTVWRSQVPKLNYIPKQGDRVVALGKVGIYPGYSQYRMQIWQISPEGAGLQALRLKQLCDSLEKEGLFDDDRKRPLPENPNIIAVITSDTAAAWGDIQRTLNQRAPGLQVLFSPATVQGDRAPASIIAALERVVADGRAEVIIVARGGGSSEDLGCFNDEGLVRSLANCPVPILTGIGHQRDQSLADWVADAAAHTPTAAAELVVPALDDWIEDHQERRRSLLYTWAIRVEQERQALERQRQRLDQLRPDRKIKQERQRWQWLRSRLIRAIETRQEIAEQGHNALQKQLEALNPGNVLQRGFAVVRDGDGAIVRDGDAVQPGDVLEIQLRSGSIQVQVIED
ncbi:MAG: exodeoxyribonuclease VII large subunit [Cyanophyceae cyanobacterium]